LAFAGEHAVSLFLLYLPYNDAELHTKCLLFFQVTFQEKIVNRREDEYNHLRQEREERINQLVTMRRQERERKRKLLYYLRSEEERLIRLREEEEAQKREGKKCSNVKTQLKALF
jgi:hypothetical protein